MSEVTFQALWTVYSTVCKGDTDAKVELGNQQDMLLTEGKDDNSDNDDNIEIKEKQEDEDNENNEEEQ